MKETTMKKKTTFWSQRVTRGCTAALAASLAFGLAFGLAGCGGSGSSDNGTRMISGASQQVAGATVSTFARVDSNNTVLMAGARVPLTLLTNPPAEPGTGNAGALVTLAFPAQVQQSTYLNHFEMQWEPDGHPPAVFQVPHFDLHFYNQTVAQVAAVAPPDPMPPAADHIPAGYLYPGADQSVPQMGVHAVDPSQFQNGFTDVMIAGFYGGRMTFVEPMVTQAMLAQKQNFTLAVPRPAVLGLSTRYPTKFTATYDTGTNAYTFVFSDFVSVTG